MPSTAHVPFVDENEIDVKTDEAAIQLHEASESIVGLIDNLPTSNYQDVGEFHDKFELDNTTHRGVYPREPPVEFIKFRDGFMQEELNEWREALAAGDIAKAADALVDLVYVALGTAHMLGLPWQSLWNEVQRANLSKVRATSASQSNRLSTFDVVKPEGWQPPDIVGVLKKYGWTEQDLKVEPIHLDKE